MTKARAAALSAITTATVPLSAAGVLAATGACCDQATVYRALHYLESAGLAESFILHCDEHGTERYYVSAAAAHRHWFHCEACHCFIDLGACRLGGLVHDLEKEQGLKVRTHVMYLTGLCRNCQNTNSPASCAGNTSGA
jgi:Fur family transcriptional regulator, ferric uptake regulator